MLMIFFWWFVAVLGATAFNYFLMRFTDDDQD